MRLTILIITALSVLAIPATASAAMKMGLEDESVFVSGNPVISSIQGYQMLNDLNIKTMRVLITQASVAEGSGFDFTAYQQAIGIAKRTRGVKELVQYLLINTAKDPFPTGLLTPTGTMTPSYAALKAANG